MKKRSTVVLAAAGLTLAIPLGWFLIFGPGILRSSLSSQFTALQADPRLVYTGPFRNVDSAVRYVPEDRCAACHVDKA